MTSPNLAAAVGSLVGKPRDEELDVYGLTHTGKVRSANQDHFLIGSLQKAMNVHYTSLDPEHQLQGKPERLAFVAMVADGVGSGSGGGEASRLAIQMAAHYLSHSTQCYYTADATNEKEFFDALQKAALHAHDTVLKKAEENPERRGMATTLTVWIGVWPHAYLLQIGDSRCYMLQKGELIQISRDQTMAQELVDQGVLTRSDADNTRWAHVLSSSIGGGQTAPVVTRIYRQWDDVGLLCSDGLTKHVSDEQIRDELRNMTSARQVCEDLLQAALDDGGTDNITIVVGRAVKND